MFDSYITPEWYRDTYPSVNKIPFGDELKRAIFNASRAVDRLTFRRATCFFDLADDGVTYVMTEDERTCIMYAVAAQVDYIAGIGYNPLDMTSADYGNGFTIGKYSENPNGDSRAQDAVSQEAIEYLRSCGLTKNGFKNQPGTVRW